MNSNRHILKFFFELGQLRKIKREGWRFAAVEQPESVAEHTLRTAQIGYFLALLEKYKDPYEGCTIALFHQIGECRIGDLHKVAQRYIEVNEEKVVHHQLQPLAKMGESLMKVWKQGEYQKTEAGKIARDADLLELAVTAKEYVDRGYEEAMDMIHNTKKRLYTKSARQLLQELERVHSSDWWRNLKKFNDVK